MSWSLIVLYHVTKIQQMIDSTDNTQNNRFVWLLLWIYGHDLHVTYIWTNYNETLAQLKAFYRAFLYVDYNLLNILYCLIWDSTFL